MKRIILLLICCMTSLSFEGTQNTFDNTILMDCIINSNNPERSRSDVNNEVGLLSGSMETFISIVERLEEKRPKWDIYDLSRVLLNRFGYNGRHLTIEGDKIVSKESDHYKYRRAIREALLGESIKSQETFDENDLRKNEKCSLYFMLGHLINTTDIKGTEQPGSIDQSSSNNEENLHREQGVVSLRGDKHHAIALGKVLLGIVASSSYTQETPVGEMFHTLSKDLGVLKSLKINTLLGVTISEVVAYSAYNARSNPSISSGSYFGQGGYWNSTVCMRDYILYETTKKSTLATIRGVIDGFLIGYTLQTMTKVDKTALTLSKVLRMYYDPRGIIHDDDSSKFRSFCSRKDFGPLTGGTKQAESAEGYYHLFQSLLAQEGRSDPQARLLIDKMFNELTSSNVLKMILPEDGVCNAEEKQVKCETKSDVFVVLDDTDKETKGLNNQAEVISILRNHLDIGLRAGSIGVYFNGHNSTSNFKNSHLQSVVHNETNAADAACQIIDYDKEKIPAALNEEMLMISLNSTLRDFELHTSENSYANSKVVVLFKYGDFKMNDDARVKRAATIVRQGHRDTRVIVVGAGVNPKLTLLATDSLDVVNSDGTTADKLATDLAERICNVPSVFKYHQCKDRLLNNEVQSTYTGYVSPHYTQYWAMYPEYFLKSFNVNFEFETVEGGGDIEVCFSRINTNPKSEASPKSSTSTCQISNSEERKLTFNMRNPCKTYNVDNCPPAYFSVRGMSDGVSNCQELNCRRTDQIEFKFSHKGVSCNGCMMLAGSPILLLFAVIAYFKN